MLPQCLLEEKFFFYVRKKERKAFKYVIQYHGGIKRRFNAPSNVTQQVVYLELIWHSRAQFTLMNLSELHPQEAAYI